MYLGFLIMSVYERWIEYVYIGVEGEGDDDNIVTDGAQPPVPSIYCLQYPVSSIHCCHAECWDHSLHAAHQCNEIMRPAPRSRRQESGRGGAAADWSHTPHTSASGPGPGTSEPEVTRAASTQHRVHSEYWFLWSLLERKHKNGRNPVRKNIYRGTLLYKVCDLFCYDSR